MNFNIQKIIEVELNELYNFADGNDDILSDLPPQDAIDTRQGMWGLTPSSVSDGDSDSKGDIGEDATSKFSTDDGIGQDGFPAYNQGADTSPSINNNLNANSAMYEDLEYNHVDGDATDDKYMLGEVVTNGKYRAFHGSDVKIDKFSDKFLGAEDAIDQEGPGIYFTSDVKEANNHGANIYEVILTPRKLVDESSHKSIRGTEILKLIKLSPDWKDHAINWDENPYVGIKNALNSLIKYSKNEKDLFQQIWYDFFRYNTTEYIRGMVNLGYDGQIVNKEYGPKHFIIYNPNVIEIVNNSNMSLGENVQQMEKHYIKTGIFTDEDRKNVMDITNGDNYTYKIAGIYDVLLTMSNSNMERREYNENYRRVLIESYNELKNYNKNVIPIKDVENLHPLDLYSALDKRKYIITIIKKIPSVYLRNLKDDIRRERDVEYDLQYSLPNIIKIIDNSLLLINDLSDDKRKKILDKVFSSKNVTFEQIKEQLENIEILYLNHNEGIDSIRDSVAYESEHGEAKILYDNNDILVVDIKSSDAMKSLGCGSQWCFTTEHGDEQWGEYADDSHVNIIYNFNEEADSYYRMVVILPTGDAYNMYNELIEYGDGYIDKLGVEKYINIYNTHDDIDENVKSFMSGSKTVEVKKKCKLGGQGNTSAACNQGDINNLTFGSIKEMISTEIKEYFSSLVPDDTPPPDLNRLKNNDNNFGSVEKNSNFVDENNNSDDMSESNIMNKINNFISSLKQKPFILSIINDLNGEILAVGGVVRDLILNKPNKDVDIIVRKVDINILIQHLEKFGKVDIVGKSFGVIKFIDDEGVDFDIALPRKENPNGEGGHQGFEIQSDENLPIEDDLVRRDATINAMAININTGEFIDPLGGLNDIEKKQMSAANPDAFNDDPLRMLRMIGFASRFGFSIEPKTMEMIINNTSKVKEIASERILIEFNKIIKNNN